MIKKVRKRKYLIEFRIQHTTLLISSNDNNRLWCNPDNQQFTYFANKQIECVLQNKLQFILRRTHLFEFLMYFKRIEKENTYFKAFRMNIALNCK